MKQVFCILLLSVLLLAGCVQLDGEELSGANQEEPEVVVDGSTMVPEESGSVDSADSSVAFEEDWESDLRAVEIDPYLVVITYSQVYKGPWGKEPGSVTKGHIANSYSIVGSLNYQNKWYRDYEAYLPRFTDEINYDGAEIIAAYFAEKAEQREQDMDAYFQAFVDGGTVFDAATEWHHYDYSNYAVTYTGYYLSVIYDGDDYTGGAHNIYGRTADIFDMRTGAVLTTADCFQDGEDAARLHQKLIEKYKEPEDSIMLSPNPTRLGELGFYFVENGVTFIYNPYEAGSFADGLREVTIPWEELEPILLINPDI